MPHPVSPVTTIALLAAINLRNSVLKIKINQNDKESQNERVYERKKEREKGEQSVKWRERARERETDR